MMADLTEAVLTLQPVTDGHPGTAPAISGPSRVLVSNEAGDGVDWVPTDEVGAEGPPGTSLITGIGAPTGGIGSDGDSYIDVSDPAEVTLYGPKEFGVWPSGIILNGPAGDAGADGVLNAPADPGEDFFIPYADGGDLTYHEDFTLSADGGMRLQRDTLNATAVVHHLARKNAATAISPIQRSPAQEFEASSWNTDTSEATIQAYRLQVIPTTGLVPFSSLVFEHNSGGGYVNAMRLTGGTVGLWDGSAWRDAVNAIGGTLVFCPSGDLASFQGSLEIAGDVGFYGTSPQPKPTGVAVTASAIHAALVSLGLISA